MTKGNTGIPTPLSRMVGNQLKELRSEKGWTLEFVGELVGKSKGAISQYEKGLTLPAVPVLIKLAQIYSVPTDLLLTGNIPDSSSVEFSDDVLDIARRLQRLSPADRLALAAVFGPAVPDEAVEKHFPPPPRARRKNNDKEKY